MEIVKQAIGIDISKDKFDVCFSVLQSSQKVTVKSTRKFSNTPKGFAERGKKIAPDKARATQDELPEYESPEVLFSQTLS